LRVQTVLRGLNHRCNWSLCQWEADDTVAVATSCLNHEVRSDPHRQSMGLGEVRMTSVTPTYHKTRYPASTGRQTKRHHMVPYTGKTGPSPALRAGSDRRSATIADSSRKSDAATPEGAAVATKSDTSWRVQQPGRQVPETDDQSGSGYGARLDRLLTSRPCVPILTSPAASVHIRLFALSGLRRNRAIGPVLPRPGRDTAAPRPMAGDSGYNAGYERDSATGAVIVVSALTAIFDRHSLRQFRTELRTPGVAGFAPAAAVSV
jgi:hypothetical protein